MPEDAGQIDTGDALPAVFTYQGSAGTPPYTYDIEVAGIGDSGITYVETPNGGNVDVTFDATLARAGSYVLELRGTVTDDLGDTDSDDPDDFDTYTIEVLPITAAWTTGSLTIPALDLGTTSTEQDTLTQQTGGAAPYTYHFEWVGGIPAGLSIVTSGASNNTVQIAVSNTMPPGTYVGTIRGQISDATGQFEGPFDIPVSVTVLGLRGFSWSPASLFEQIEAPNLGAATSSVVAGIGGVAPYSYLMFWETQADSFGIVTSGASGETVQIQTKDVGPATYNGTIAARVTDSVGNQIEVALPVEIDLLAEPPPVSLGFNDYLTTFFDIDHDWRLDVDNDNAHLDSGTASLTPNLTSGAASSSIPGGDVGYETDRAIRFTDVSNNGLFDTLSPVASQISGGHFGVVVLTPPGEVIPSGGTALWWAIGDNGANGQFNFQMCGPWTTTSVRHQQVDQAGNTFLRVFALPSGVIDDGVYHKLVVVSEQDGTSPRGYWDGVEMALTTENYAGAADEDYWIADSPRTANWHIGAAAFGSNSWMVGDVSRVWLSNDVMTSEQVAALNSKRAAPNTNNP